MGWHGRVWDITATVCALNYRGMTNLQHCGESEVGAWKLLLRGVMEPAIRLKCRRASRKTTQYCPLALWMLGVSFGGNSSRLLQWGLGSVTMSINGHWVGLQERAVGLRNLNCQTWQQTYTYHCDSEDINNVSIHQDRLGMCEKPIYHITARREAPVTYVRVTTQHMTPRYTATF